jgi:hypothetical protein
MKISYRLCEIKIQCMCRTRLEFHGVSLGYILPLNLSLISVNYSVVPMIEIFIVIQVFRLLTCPFLSHTTITFHVAMIQTQFFRLCVKIETKHRQSTIALITTRKEKVSHIHYSVHPKCIQLRALEAHLLLAVRSCFQVGTFVATTRTALSH